MEFVRPIGVGYYGLETEGVTITKEVRDCVDMAFKVASSIQDKDLNIQTAPVPALSSKA